MPLRYVFVLSLLLCCLGTGAIGHAQDVSSTWTGEWGVFGHAPSTTGIRRFEGHGLSISDCTGQQCAFSVVVQNKKNQGDAAGFLQLQSRTEAVAHLVFQKKEYCSLRLTLDANQPSITVRQDAGDCSFFETPGASFVQTYPLHTRDHYYAGDVPACFTATERTQLAICTSKALAAQRLKWQILFWTVAGDTGTATTGPAQTTLEQSAQVSLLRSCKGAAKVADCLTAAFAQSTRNLNARRAAWLGRMTAPGDRAKAARVAATIAGSYRHTFPNGDVQGDKFPSTDTMEVHALPQGAIHFALKLWFYNGHQCSLQGTAIYNRAGFFVDKKQTNFPKSPVCIFEILPESDGVKFADPTGACKMLSCGERGGYNNVHFSMKDRQ